MAATITIGGSALRMQGLKEAVDRARVTSDVRPAYAGVEGKQIAQSN